MSTKNKVFQLRLDEETRKKLKALSKYYDESESAVIRRLIIVFYDLLNKLNKL